ncbi:MAG: HDIG domain-containing protein [Kiritimatiellae bacterium]|nr:HDIG domain-containing protein [Kiritimatiellia bacterium]
MDTIKEEIARLVSALKRPGSAAVLCYIEGSRYFTCGCYSHHMEEGGLAKHSLEVYRFMCRHAGDIPLESVVVAALFHDLGKTRASDGRGHGARSLDILDECGFELKPDERIAIGNHHEKSLDIITCRLRRVLTLGDCASTGRWKQEQGLGL